MERFESIVSRENPVIKNIVKLISSAKERRRRSLFVTEGARLCGEIPNSKITAEIFAVSESALKKEELTARSISASAARSIVIPDALFSKISDTKTPQGMLCVCKIPKVAPFSGNGSYIALENTQDPSNLGAVARTAEAFGIDGIIVSKNGCDPYSPKAQRAGMGALLRLPVETAEDFLLSVKEKANRGARIYGAAVDDGAQNILKTDFSGNTVILIGNEANGLTDEAKALCDRLVKIPMPGRAESLNASVAAAVFMWEVLKSHNGQ